MSKVVADDHLSANKGAGRALPGRQLAVAAALIALAGLVVALTMPYGPATAAHALAVIGSSLVVGLLARRLASGCLVFTFLVTFAL